jgi:hypothetical protein
MLRAVVCVVATALVGAASASQLPIVDAREFEGINSGEGFHSLYFKEGGVQLQAAQQQVVTLSARLARTFTFECWAMLPQQSNDGRYKTITGRWQRGPDGFHNRWSDWDFQVQASGDINFFMGNGGLSIYGILLSPGRTLMPGEWAHMGFKVVTAPNEYNPSSGIVFVNDEEFRRDGWIGGNRQELPEQPIWLGSYFNQDGDFKVWKGYLDEVRFWNTERSLDQLIRNRNRVLPYDELGLLAYYRLNDGGGSTVRAEGRPEYDGRIDDRGIDQSATWRVSGAKINVDFRTSPGAIRTLRLPGIEPPPGGQLSFQYIISSLPQEGILLADGQVVTQVPFRLSQNSVHYQAVEAPTLDFDSFTYYGQDEHGNRERWDDAVAFVQVGYESCARDMCGRCDGDNATCTCHPLPYNGLSLADIERVLLLFEIEQVLDIIMKLEEKFDELLNLLQPFTGTDIQVYVNEMLDFNEYCLMTFCERLDPYMDRLAAIGPSA